MVIEVRPLQPLNADSPMLVTSFGMTVFWQPAISLLVEVSMMALQLLRESNVVLSSATVMVVRPLHLLNAPAYMLVTLSGIVTEVRLVQDENALLPMLVTEYVLFPYLNDAGMIMLPEYLLGLLVTEA